MLFFYALNIRFVSTGNFNDENLIKNVVLILITALKSNDKFALVFNLKYIRCNLYAALNDVKNLNKRPMGHITHLRNIIIMLIKRKNSLFTL